MTPQTPPSSGRRVDAQRRGTHGTGGAPNADGARGAHRSRGFSLVELMVAVTIGLVLTLAITGVMTRSEAARRMTTSVADVAMNGAYLSYTLDRTLRSAGSGFSQARAAAWGCRLLAARGGVQVLPRSGTFPAPFAAVPGAMRLAPLVVHAGLGAGGSDVLAVATGASALGESPLTVLGSVTGTGLRVPATVGLRGGDLVLVARDTTNCMLQQVKAGFAGGATQTIEFAGTYAANTIASIDLTDFGAGTAAAQVVALGNVAGNQPEIQLLGIHTDQTLVKFDVLRLDGTDAVTPLAEGVVDLRTRYGVDGDDDGKVDTWVDPSAAPWDAASLLAGTAVAQQSIGRILAVRVGLILRNTSPEKGEVRALPPKLFGDLGAPYTYTPSTATEKALRYRTLEFTVPLRNVMFKAS